MTVAETDGWRPELGLSGIFFPFTPYRIPHKNLHKTLKSQTGGPEKIIKGEEVRTHRNLKSQEDKGDNREKKETRTFFFFFLSIPLFFNPFFWGGEI